MTSGLDDLEVSSNLEILWFCDSVIFSLERPYSRLPVPKGDLKVLPVPKWGNVLKLKEGTFKLVIRKKFFPLRVVVTRTVCPEKLWLTHPLPLRGQKPSVTNQDGDPGCKVAV